MTYLPAPLKAPENNLIMGDKSNVFKGAAYTLALGILAYYAPKTFVLTAVLLIGYQISRFNEIVHKSKHQEILPWTINSCQVMWSIGTVFFIKSLPWFWSSLKAAKHFHLLRSSGHLTIGLLLAGGIGGSLVPFADRAKVLATCAHWVEMEDYVENYPANIKQEFSSSTLKKIAFYISAVIPNTIAAHALAKIYFPFGQFGSTQDKVDSLIIYFNKLLPSIPTKNPEWEKWTLAIHLFQELPIEGQLALGPHLARFANASSPAQREQLPDEVFTVILNERFKKFSTIPLPGDADHAEWMNIVEKGFYRLDDNQRLALGDQLLRLALATPKIFVSEEIRVVILKACFRQLAQNPSSTTPLWACANALFPNLRSELQKEFEPVLQSITANYTPDQLNALAVSIRWVMGR